MQTNEKTVPNVVGLKRADIAKAFAESGLRYNIIGSGEKVLNQVPKGGSSLGEGSTVALYTEADKTATVIVPDVRGRTATDANVILTNAGLNMKVFGASASGQGSAVVSSQSPEAGSEVDRGSAVSVEFSFSNVH